MFLFVRVIWATYTSLVIFGLRIRVLPGLGFSGLSFTNVLALLYSFGDNCYGDINFDAFGESYRDRIAADLFIESDTPLQALASKILESGLKRIIWSFLNLNPR